jgi:hypothetical protein
MKKFTYIRLSQTKANKKIWESLIAKYNILKQKNKYLGCLWLIPICTLFGLIAIISWLSFLTMFLKNTRFTLHYLQTVIRSQGMTKEQVNHYLDTQVLIYKTYLSYGNISPQARNRIDSTFELLYTEYRISESTDNKQDIINPILESIKGHGGMIAGYFREIKQLVAKGNNDIRMIENYTNWKQAEEKREIERKQQLMEEQAKRTISAHNRAQGRMLTSFESALSNEQLYDLTACCNEIPIFTRDIEVTELADILSCTHKEPLQVDVNKHLSLLFDQLREHKLVCKTWMSVAERHNCFISKQGKPILSKDLSAALSTASIIKWEIEDLIKGCVKAISE